MIFNIIVSKCSSSWAFGSNGSKCWWSCKKRSWIMHTLWSFFEISCTFTSMFFITILIIHIASYRYSTRSNLWLWKQSGDRFVVKVRVSKYTAARVFFEHFIYKITDQEVGVPIFHSSIRITHSENKLCMKKFVLDSYYMNVQLQPIAGQKTTGVWLDTKNRPIRIPAEARSNFFRFISEGPRGN